MDRCNWMFRDNAPDNRDVTLDVSLDLVIGQLDHRDNAAVFLVLVPHKDRKRLTDPRVMKDAFAWKRHIAFQNLFGSSMSIVPVCLRDRLIYGRMILLA